MCVHRHACVYLDVTGVSQEHGHSVNAEAPPPCGRQSIFKSSAEVLIYQLCLIVSCSLVLGVESGGRGRRGGVFVTSQSSQLPSQPATQPASYPPTQPATQPATHPPSQPLIQLPTHPVSHSSSYPPTQSATHPATQPDTRAHTLACISNLSLCTTGSFNSVYALQISF